MFLQLYDKRDFSINVISVTANYMKIAILNLARKH